MKEGYVKQHIVPQSYLRRFAEKNTHKGGFHIGVRHVSDGSIRFFLKAIDNVAFVKNYYDVSCRDDKKHWEHLFSEEIEPLYGDFLDRFVSKVMLNSSNQNILNDDDKSKLSRMISFQFLRVPVFLDPHINRVTKESDELRAQLLNQFSALIPDEQLKQLQDMDINDTVRDMAFEHISDMERLNEYSKILENHVWTVCYNNTSIPFITSDNPVILYNYVLNNVTYNNGGIARSDTLVLFPISTKILLRIAPREMFLDAGKRIDNTKIVINEDNEMFIIIVNDLQIRHASSEVYIDPSFTGYIQLMKVED